MSKRQDPVYQAMNILASRDHARAEVITKLKHKGFSEEEVAKAIDYLQEKKLLDDTRFAKAYADSMLRTKPVGPRYISAKLKQKGVGETIARQTVRELFSEGRGREAFLAQQAAEQWKKSHPKHAGDKQRLYRFLASRGFTSDAIA